VAGDASKRGEVRGESWKGEAREKILLSVKKCGRSQRGSVGKAASRRGSGRHNQIGPEEDAGNASA